MADILDKITDVRNGARPNSARVTIARTAGGTVLSCNALTGWATASKVHFVTYQIDANSNPIPGTQLDCYGIVSGATITNFTVIDGTDGGNSVGDVVEMLPTAAWGQDLADALTEEHDRQGIHTSAAIATIGAALYPVGSIYTQAAVSTNPATLLGFGTWTAFGAGRVMIGVDSGDASFDTLGETGGSKTSAHTHAMSRTNAYAEITGIGNSIYMYRSGHNFTSNHFQNYSGTAANQTDSPTFAAGVEGATESNAPSVLQPYITVYMWRRTA